MRFFPTLAHRNKIPLIESTLTTEERAADVRFFKNVTLRDQTPEQPFGRPETGRPMPRSVGWPPQKSGLMKLHGI